MKILKYTKISKNTYKIDFEKTSCIFYDDIILKHELLLRKQITEKELEELKKENIYYNLYYESIKYLEKKLRTKKELEEYLKKEAKEESVVNSIIKKLEQEKYLNDEKYIEYFINDAIKFNTDGPSKIKQKLLLKGVEENKIELYLGNINAEIWQEKIKKIIEKKIKGNHRDSESLLKNKLMNYCLEKGYSKDLINPLINDLEIPRDNTILLKEKEKLQRKLERKFKGESLTYQIKIKLYQKGFNKKEIEEALKKDEE